MKETDLSSRAAHLSRRQLLKAAGVLLPLPTLPSLLPAPAKAAGLPTPRRFLAICNNLSVVPANFFPTETGRGYALSPSLQRLATHREEFTVFSGVSHPDVDGGHPADNCFLTAAPHPASGGFRNTVSLDQFAAQHIGHLTRFPSITLGVNQDGGQRSLSWTPGGVLIPCEQRPSALYARMFLRGDAEAVRQQLQRLDLGRSVMDAVAEQAKGLDRKLGLRDKDKLDQYFTAVRDLEARLVKARSWEDVPRPAARGKSPTDLTNNKQFMAKTKLMYDMARLAFETDSTRLITIMLDGVSTPPMDFAGAEIKDSYHNLSHHGQSEDKLAQLAQVDSEHMKLLSDLFTALKSSKEDGETLFDRTMVLFGSNMGDANSHVTTNLPILFAGGGFKHGQHLTFDRDHNYPLPNLFVTVLQRLGLKTEKFASSTGTMRGLSLA